MRSLSVHYIYSPDFGYCVVMVRHKDACEDIVKHMSDSRVLLNVQAYTQVLVTGK